MSKFLVLTWIAILLPKAQAFDQITVSKIVIQLNSFAASKCTDQDSYTNFAALLGYMTTELRGSNPDSTEASPRVLGHVKSISHLVNQAMLLNQQGNPEGCEMKISEAAEAFDKLETL